jgi:transcription antitermination factor NusG
MSFWAVAQTMANRESFVAERIAEVGFDIFAPMTRQRINGVSRVVALFPGYLFVRIIDRWRVVTKTAGVLGLVMSGETPARCPEVEIDRIKSQTRNGLVRLPKPPKSLPLKIGEPVRIVSGSFRGFEAIYDGMSTRDREQVLLNMFGRETPVELAAGDQLSPLASQTSLIYMGGN